jgi:hypothetical protein
MLRPVLPLFLHIREFGWGVQAMTQTASGAEFRDRCCPVHLVQGTNHSTNCAAEGWF